MVIKEHFSKKETVYYAIFRKSSRRIRVVVFNYSPKKGPSALLALMVLEVIWYRDSYSVVDVDITFSKSSLA